MGSICFFTERIRFKVPFPRKTSYWLKSVIAKEGREPGTINYIFCSDEFLADLNRKYLSHDTLTDIITFDYSDGNRLHGDIYISIPRVLYNSKSFETDFYDELCRVMVHGVLHLAGYNDKTASQKRLMREREDKYLSLRLK